MNLIDADLHLLRTFRARAELVWRGGWKRPDSYIGPVAIMALKGKQWGLEVWLGVRWSPWCSLRPGKNSGAGRMWLTAEFPPIRILANWPWSKPSVTSVPGIDSPEIVDTLRKAGM